VPRPLLLITTQSYRAGAFLDAARSLGVEYTVGTDRAQALAGLNPRGHLVLDFRDVESALVRIQEFAREHPLDTVIAADDEGAVLAARANEELSLQGNRAEAVATARDKRSAREAFARAGLLTPPFFSMPITDSPADWADRMPYPCVLKPRGLAASRGVIRANDPGQFVEAFERIRAILQWEPERDGLEPPTDAILVERFIPGVEVSLEGVLSDGRLQTLAIFDKPDPLDGPYFEETLYITPSRLPAETQRAVTETTSRAVRALGLRHGPVHAEFRVNGEGVWPLEIAPRSIGGLCSRALRFAGGDTLEMLVLRHALGLDVSGVRREAAASGVMMIPIPRAGILRGVKGIERARNVPGIEDVRISIPVGARLVPLPEGSQYLGFLFARGVDPRDVETSLRTSHSALEFEIETASAVKELEKR